MASLPQAPTPPPHTHTHTNAHSVWGVGQSTADRWYEAGLRTLDDIRRQTGLGELQAVGLMYYDDFQVGPSTIDPLTL